MSQIIDPDQDLSHKLKELLTLRGMTAYQLSKQTGLSRDYLSKLLNGQINNPGLDKIQKIATALNVELETFHLEAITSCITPVPILSCVGRQQELTQLEQWVLQDTTQIVWIWGLAGIGKSSLAASLAQRVQNHFELVIWHDLAYASPTTPNWISSVTQCSRSLILIDHADELWNQPHSNSLPQTSTDALQAWVHQLQTLPNRCCLIGISREKPKWLRLSENVFQTVRSLKLNGLGIDARSLLENKGLRPCPQWDDLIALYRGHPLALNLAAIAIQDVFGGSVTEFLKQNTLFLGDLRPLLKQQIDRLSNTEHQILISLASVLEPVDFNEVNQLMTSPQRRSHIIEAINSLIGRSLIETTRSSGEIYYGLQPLVRQYVISERATSPDPFHNFA
jgi:transcriptional regulator with XRE-family HTH domain